MSTICVTSPTLTSISVASSPTVVNTTSNVVITPQGDYTNVTFTTCVPITEDPIVRRQQRCRTSVIITPTFVPGTSVFLSRKIILNLIDLFDL